MEKIELKHLAPYLPYGVQLKGNTHGDIFTLEALKETGLRTTETGYDNWEDLYDFKPILRPLSDLTKEIEHNGEKFVPLHQMVKDLVEQVGRTKYQHFIASDGSGMVYATSNESWQLQYKVKKFMFRLHDFSLGKGKTKGSKSTEHYINQYEGLQRLLEWHFDVFSLIPAGLAEPIK